MSHLLTRSLFLFALASPALPAPHRPDGDEGALLRAVPADAVVVVRTPPLDELRERADENAWFALVRDPELEQLWDYALADLHEATAEELGELDVFKALEGLHGPLVVFVAANPVDGEPIFGILVEPGEERAAFDEELDRAIELLEGNTTATSDQYGEIELRIYEDSEGSGQSVLFEHAGLVGAVMADERDALLSTAHGVLDRYRGEDPAEGFAASPLCAEARAGAGQAGGARGIEAVVDVARMIELSTQGDEADEEARRIVESIGLTRVRWVWAAADLGEGERLEFEFAMHVPEEGHLARWIDQLGTLPLGFARRIPREVDSANLGQLNVGGLWDAVWDFVREVDADNYEQARAGFEMLQQSLGVDFEEDLVRQLSGAFAQFTLPVPEEEWLAANAMLGMLDEEEEGAMLAAMESMPRVGDAFVLGLADVAVVENSIEDLLAQSGMDTMVESEEFQGEYVQTFDAGEVPLSWAFAEKLLVISQYPTAVRACLRTLGGSEVPSVLDNERFGKMFEANRGASMLGIADTRQVLRAALAAVQLLWSMEIDWSEIDPDGEPVEAPPAKPALPGPELIERHLEGQLVSIMRRAGGSLRFSFSARSPED